MSNIDDADLATIAWLDGAHEAGKRARETIAKLTAERDEARDLLKEVLTTIEPFGVREVAIADDEPGGNTVFDFSVSDVRVIRAMSAKIKEAIK